MLDAMINLIQKQRMLTGQSRVLCAVSGGADSVCLLHALYQLRPALGFTLTAAHYNHNLRGGESGRDEQFVRDFVARHCGQQKLPDGRELPAVELVVGGGDVAAAARETGAGLEETAREMRYAFLQQAAQKTGCTTIATAHNADDNAETVLLHLARGSALRGLGGIAPVRGNILRPLLTTTREEIEEYLAYHGLEHVEDSSNADVRFSRNRLRHQVMPVLEELYPGFVQRMVATTQAVRADEEYMTAQAKELSGKAVASPQGLSIPAKLLASAPAAVATRAVRELIGRLNGGDQDCAAVHLWSVLDLCRDSDPSAQISLPYGLVARREYDALILDRGGELPGFDEVELNMPGETTVGDWDILCFGEFYTSQSQGPWSIWLSPEQLHGPLTVRTRKTGDRIQLSGRPEKTLKKWMIDEKVPANLRASLPVFDCGGTVAAVAGLGSAQSMTPTGEAMAWHITVQRNITE